MIVAENEENRRQVICASYHNAAGTIRSQTGLPSLKKPVFVWNVKNKFIELKDFEMEVTNIFHTKCFELSDTEKVAMTKMGWRVKASNLYKNKTRDMPTSKRTILDNR